MTASTSRSLRRTAPLRASVLAALMACALVLTACGGGGGSSASPSTTPRLGGLYWALFAGANDPAGTERVVFWAPAIVQGGQLTLEQGIRVDLGGPESNDPELLDVVEDAAGGLRVSEQGTSVAGGAVVPSGDLALLGLDQANFDPGQLLLMRRASGVTDAALTGTYKVGGWLTESTGDVLSFWGTWTLDGAGNFTGSLAVSQEGVVLAPTLVTGQYGTNPDGSLEMLVGSTIFLVGATNADGSVCACVGSTQPGSPGTPSMFVLVRESSGQSPTNVEGTYEATGLLENTSSGVSTEGLSGQLTLAGSGGSYVRLLDLDPATPPAMQIGGVTHVVTPVGGLGVSIPGLMDLDGQRTADGRFGFLAGSVSASEPSALMLLLRP